MGILSYILRS